MTAFLPELSAEVQAFVRAVSAKIKQDAEPDQRKKEGIVGKEPAR